MTFISRLERAVRNSHNPGWCITKLVTYTMAAVVFSMMPLMVILAGSRLVSGLFLLALLLAIYLLFVGPEIWLVMHQQAKRDRKDAS